MKGLKRRDNKLYFTFQGQRRAKSYPSPEKAAEALKVVEGAVLAGDLTMAELVRKPVKEEKKNISFYIELWLAGGAKTTLKRSTLEDYHGMLRNHIKGTVLDKTTTDQVSQLDVENFLLKKLDSGLANSTVTHIRNCLSGGFKTALKDRTITTNPCHGFKISTKRDMDRKPKIEPLTANELQTLLGTFFDHRFDHYALVMVLARSGLRIGEAVALQWDDLHFEDRYIHVQRNFTRGRMEKTTKNGKDRKVDMSKELVTVLRERKLAVQKKSEFVFPSSGKNPVDPNNWRKRVFTPMLKKSGLRKIRVHDLRHTFASLLIHQTQDLHYVKEMCGHHSIKVTIDVYGHLMKPEGKERKVDKLDNLVNAN